MFDSFIPGRWVLFQRRIRVRWRLLVGPNLRRYTTAGGGEDDNFYFLIQDTKSGLIDALAADLSFIS